MTKIIFKDVGQGDSIIIEWLDDNQENKIGIIDCKKNNSLNPILKHIQDTNVTHIEFIILSHPHRDHYSGLKELLVYCYDNEITIGSFLHTLNNDIEVEYWTYFEPNLTNALELADVFDIVNKSYNVNLNEIVKLSVGYTIPLNKTDYLKCLSPSHLEITEYLKALKFIPIEHRMKRSKVANLLSSLFKLKLGDKYILLTSDVEKISFDRVKNKNSNLFHDKINVLSQIPHHGSDTNHEPSFWSQLILNETSEAVISAGEHKLYMHPHFNVINDFSGMGYKISSTNVINGMEEFVEIIKIKSLTLDTDSLIAEEYYLSGDKIFNL
ncbi:hypothetical protein H8R23_14545 [Flavobacterium sp. F-380]|uniref:Metallo-beta-lactamase domain-containing protein n=1 Tax=Flavobacterium kayseriense TaxID=2764714 RepID=A0ABR7JAW1_9FLAO|nr:hypothetical protein [Flavobacterium kayseriense]MBC5842630.1 hypothetical protein [Flavobacterium kayseriense]MBC5849160.1 hypothetical protein [Flavobacterium kayseriense]